MITNDNKLSKFTSSNLNVYQNKRKKRWKIHFMKD